MNESNETSEPDEVALPLNVRDVILAYNGNAWTVILLLDLPIMVDLERSKVLTIRTAAVGHFRSERH